jgi:hypothetical protein
MTSERDRKDDDRDVPATFTGESTGSGPGTGTNIGRGGDPIIEDDVVYGRATSDRDHAERERARAEKSTDAPADAEERKTD